MNDLQRYPVWSVVKFDLIGKEFEREFNAHFDEHIQELAEREGFCRAWRTREARRSWNLGLLEQEFCQIYQIDEPTRFRTSMPNRGTAPATEKEPWRRDLSGWGRVFYRVLLREEKDDRQGRYWARYEVDFKGSAAQEGAFKRELGDYVRQVSAQTGVHRGWLLEQLPHELQVDKDPVARHMAMFEIDAPESIFDPSLGQDRLSWPGKAAGVEAPLVGRHFAHLLLMVTDMK